MMRIGPLFVAPFFNFLTAADWLKTVSNQQSSAFRVGSVLVSSMNAYARNIGIFILMSLIVYLPYYSAHALAPGDLAAAMSGPTEDIPADMQGFLPLALGLALATYAIAFLVGPAIGYIAFVQHRGAPGGMGHALAAAWRAYPVLLGATGIILLLLLGVGLVGALTTMLVTTVTQQMWLSVATISVFSALGVIVFLTYCVTDISAVVEHKGVFASLSRSAMLTKGKRWRLFALLLLCVLLLIVLTILAVVPATLLGLPSWPVEYVVAAAIFPFFAVVSGITYDSLCRSLAATEEAHEEIIAAPA